MIQPHGRLNLTWMCLILVIYVHWTLIFEPYVVRCGVKNMCSKELGLCAQSMMNILNLHNEHIGGERIHDHLMSTRIVISKVYKIFI